MGAESESDDDDDDDDLHRVSDAARQIREDVFARLQPSVGSAVSPLLIERTKAMVIAAVARHVRGHEVEDHIGFETRLDPVELRLHVTMVPKTMLGRDVLARLAAGRDGEAPPHAE